ncbi:MAG: flagellar motor switch protein FliN [Planctomycetia bacterium]|nr:flagellar motor switch protein FliN [Planctomycetia bacterium]
MAQRTVLKREELDALLERVHVDFPTIPNAELPDLPGEECDAEKQRRAYCREQLAALGNIEMEVRVELGKTSMLLKDAAMLRSGSVVVLDRNVSEPVNVLVNGKMIARGELIVVDGKFSVRIVEFV